MALFSFRDRIAIVAIVCVICLGWSTRYLLHRYRDPGGVRVIRGAVEVPPALMSPDSLAAIARKISVVDINSADASSLEALPMIGPVKATAVVAYRDRHGPFAVPGDIMKVNGIGPATYEAIRDFITVDPDSAGGR